MTILGVALFSLSRIEGGLAIGDAASNQVLYCAEAGLGRAQLDRGPKAQLEGNEPGALPPFLDLPLDPAAIRV